MTYGSIPVAILLNQCLGPSHQILMQLEKASNHDATAVIDELAVA
jgi:hypothetical protein